MEIAWQIYNSAISDESVEPLNLLAVASRASQKTLLMAAVEMAVMFHDRRSLLHWAAAKEQLSACLVYIQEFAYRPIIKDFLDGEPSKSLVKFKIPLLEKPDDVKKIQLKCLSITPHNVQGQHSAGMIVDEILTLKHEKKTAYKQLQGIPVSHNGKPYFRAEISSRRGPYTVVEENIASAAKTGLQVKTWTAFELTKRCPDSRSGTIPATFYSDPLSAMIISEEEFESLPLDQRDKYHKAEAFDGCLTCPMASQCCGDLKKQKSQIPFLNTVEHTLATFKQCDLVEWTSQRMSLRPSSEGLIFSKFAVERHVKSAKEILEHVLGKAINYVPTHNQLIKEMLDAGGQTYVGIDWSGGSAEGAIVVGIFYPAKQILYIVDYVAKEALDMEETIAILKRFEEAYKIKTIFPDPASVDKNSILRNRGFKVGDKIRKEVLASVEITRSMLMSADGTIRIYFLQDKTFKLQMDVSKYHFIELPGGGYGDAPAEEFSHGCFTAENAVTTKEGIKNISDIRPGDEVLTHNGRFKRVLNVMSKDYEGEILKMDFCGREVITCTPDHPLWAKRFSRSTKIENGKKLTGQRRPEPEMQFIPAEKFIREGNKHKPSYYAGSKLVREVKDIIFPMKEWLNKDRKRLWQEVENGKIKHFSKPIYSDKTLALTADVAFFLGHYCAEGSKAKGKQSQKNVSIACHARELGSIEFYEKAFKEKFFLNNIFIRSDGLGRCAHFNNVFLYTLVKELDIGSYKNKKLPNFIYNLNDELLYSMLAGLFFGDGCFTAGFLRYSTISKNMAYQALWSLLSIGYKPRMRLAKRAGRWKGYGKGGIIANDQYYIELSFEDTNRLLENFYKIDFIKKIYSDGKQIKQQMKAKQSSFRQYIDEGYLWTSVLTDVGVEKMYYKGKVYNMEVEDDHSYTVNGVAVKNCDALRYLVQNLVENKGKFMVAELSDKEQKDQKAMEEQWSPTDIIKRSIESQIREKLGQNGSEMAPLEGLEGFKWSF